MELFKGHLLAEDCDDDDADGGDYDDDDHDHDNNYGDEDHASDENPGGEVMMMAIVITPLFAQSRNFELSKDTFWQHFPIT